MPVVANPHSPKARPWLPLLLLLQTAVLVFTVLRTGPGLDEFFHLPAGIIHWRTGDMEPYRVNPPLVQMLAALPLYLQGVTVPDARELEHAGSRTEFQRGGLFSAACGEDFFKFYTWARLMCVPIAVIGTGLMYVSGQRMYGDNGGWIPAILWACSPMVIGFGASITPDVASAVGGLAAALAFHSWIRQPSLTNVMLLGIGISLAMLTKLTWVILPPVLVASWALVRLAQHRVEKSQRPPFWQLIIAIAWALFLVNLVYGFQGTGKLLGKFAFESKQLKGSSALAAGASNRFSTTPLGNVPLPLPEDYVFGIDKQLQSFSNQTSYFLGTQRDTGWWYFYLVGIPVKEPEAFWLLFPLGCVCAWYARRQIGLAQWTIVLPGLAALLVVSDQTAMSRHIRYALPAYPAIYLMTGAVALAPWRWIKHVAGLLVIGYAASSLTCVPYSYAYVARALGGPSQSWWYLQSSNVDWGQGLQDIKQHITSHPERQPVMLLATVPWGISSIIPGAIDGAGMMDQSDPEHFRLAAGWWIISTEKYAKHEALRWVMDDPRVEKLTPTLHVIKIEPSP